MMNFYSNGFIVRDINVEKYGSYRGVDGTWWNRYSDYSVNVDIYDEKYVDVCTSLGSAIEYARYMQHEGNKVEILYCCSTIKQPNINMDNKLLESEFKFIGYDYAYQNGSFYSCVFFDIGRISELNHFIVNEYGLLQDEKEILSFVKKRNLLTKSDKIRFESGGFIIYKLWMYTGNNLGCKGEQ